jgi:AcrR family transcriptional regulator
MSLKERHERDRQRTQKAILDAARDLFLAEGYQNISMRKIADRIDYSPAAIYSYFASKDDLFFALAAEGFQILARGVLGAIRDVADPFQRLRLGLWAFYQFAKTHPEYFALMFLDRSVPSLSQDFQRFEFFRQTTARAEADIRTCIDSGIFAKSVNPAAALHVLWAGVLGAATIGLAQRLAPGENPDALARDVLESLLAGITTPVTTTFVPADCPLVPNESAVVSETESHA